MPSPISKPPRSADAILASYLEEQERRMSANRKRTNSKLPYKFGANSPSQLNCANLTRCGVQPQARSFFPHLSDSLSSNEPSAQQPPSASSIVQIQRKFLALFYIYVIVIVSLYLTYAVYCYYQQNQFKKQEHDLQELQTSAASQIPAASLASSSETVQQEQLMQELQTKLENKIHLLERYIEVLAVDLEATKTRLSEREKCACSINCSFNGTKYADQQTWNQKCDVCKCQAGKISCQPRECPKLSCQNDPEAVIQTLPGQCCPSCMLKCKVNKMLVRHGHSFKPMDSNGQQTKQCKCLNGLIKCDPIGAQLKSDNLQVQARSANKTIEYLKSILGPKFVLESGRARPG